MNGIPSIPSTPSIPQPGSAAFPAASQGGFTAALQDAIGQVEQMQSDAQQQAAALLQGDRQDVHNVMIAVEKADVAFQLMMQVRNKIVNAYQEISRMQF